VNYNSMSGCAVCSRPWWFSRKIGAFQANRQAKETKRGELDGKDSECPIVALKRGNGPYRTPWSEGGAALWTRRRNHAEDTASPACHRKAGKKTGR
jgi:hypothetical protein